MSRRATYRRSRGVTLVEGVVVSLLVLPLFLIAWNALIGARVAEETMSLLAAVRGARLFESHLRRDLVNVSLSLGPDACTTSPEKICLALAPFGSGRNEAFMAPGATGLITYAFEPLTRRPTNPSLPQPLKVTRNGTAIHGVALERCEATVVGEGLNKWIRVDLVTIDPGLRCSRTTGTYISCQTTILAPLPKALNAGFLVDYTKYPLP